MPRLRRSMVVVMRASSSPEFFRPVGAQGRAQLSFAPFANAGRLLCNPACPTSNFKSLTSNYQESTTPFSCAPQFAVPC